MLPTISHASRRGGKSKRHLFNRIMLEARKRMAGRGRQLHLSDCAY